MTDRTEKFERELAAMRPRSISRGLAERIERDLSRSIASRWPDRFLVATMSAGAIAACVIVGILSNDSHAPSSGSPVIGAIQEPMQASGSPLAFARSDPAWLDALK